MLVIIPINISVKFTKEEVVRLFLEVPDKVIKLMHSKCESFVSAIQIGDDDEGVSEIEEFNFDKEGNEENS